MAQSTLLCQCRTTVAGACQTTAQVALGEIGGAYNRMIGKLYFLAQLQLRRKVFVDCEHRSAVSTPSSLPSVLLAQMDPE